MIHRNGARPPSSGEVEDVALEPLPERRSLTNTAASVSPLTDSLLEPFLPESGSDALGQVKADVAVENSEGDDLEPLEQETERDTEDAERQRAEEQMRKVRAGK